MSAFNLCAQLNALESRLRARQGPQLGKADEKPLVPAYGAFFSALRLVGWHLFVTRRRTRRRLAPIGRGCF